MAGVLLLLPLASLAALPFRCTSLEQERRAQRARAYAPVYANATASPACAQLHQLHRRAFELAYKVNKATPKDKYHRVIGKEAWRAAGKEGYTELLGMPPTVARVAESLTMIVEEILENGVAGGLMETGVWTGFMSMAITAVLKVHDARGRDYWLCDSFNGLPAPEERFSADRGSKFHLLRRHELGGPAFTQQNFEAAGLRGVGRQHWEVGFFNDTMPGLLGRVGQLALLRLDGDMFQSTWEVLHAMYPKLQVGGYLVMDDYDLAPFRKAITQFRDRYGITEKIVSPKIPVLQHKRLPHQGNYWRVERQVTVPQEDLLAVFPHMRQREEKKQSHR